VVPSILSLFAFPGFIDIDVLVKPVFGKNKEAKVNIVYRQVLAIGINGDLACR